MTSKHENYAYLLLLILAGEAVFILPFVLTRVFRPTVLEVFNLSNLELGTAQSIYGIVAVFAYLLGGPLADRYQPRKLIAIALWTTALGGIVYGSFPSLLVLKVLYGYWGFTTIFLLWAAMIKATRVWGGETSQGKAFGFLDGGRGLVGALFGLLGVLIFSFFVTEAIELAVFTERQNAFQIVIWISSTLVAFIGVLVWFFLKTSTDDAIQTNLEKITLQDIKKVLSIPSV
ncbi:MAG: MFS family permease, partial [Psychroserpens sp.]